MNDPCVRKATTPLPVFTPHKSDTTIGDLIEDLIILNSDCGDKTTITANGDIKEGNKVTVEEDKSIENPPKKSEVTVGEDKSIEPPMKKSKVDLEDDLLVSEEESGERCEWKLLPITADVKKTKKIRPKSKEFISSESEDETITCHAKNTPSHVKVIDPLPLNGKTPCVYRFKNNPKKDHVCGVLSKENLCPPHKKIIERSKMEVGVTESPKKIRDLENSVAESSKKIRELEHSLSELKKIMEEKEKKNKRSINDLEKDFQKLKERCKDWEREVEKRLEKNLSLMKNKIDEIKSSVRDNQTNLQEIENKLDHFSKNNDNTLTEKSVCSVEPEKCVASDRKLNSKFNKVPTRINKLNQQEEYKLVGYSGSEGVFTSSNGRQYQMKIPGNLKQPRVEENLVLQFNCSTSKFQWKDA